jgi:hypothetical protein
VNRSSSIVDFFVIIVHPDVVFVFVFIFIALSVIRWLQREFVLYELMNKRNFRELGIQ